MNRGAGRQAVFRTTADRLEFGARLAAIHEEYGVTMLAYCLMGNYFHLMAREPEPGALSVAMQHLSSLYTRRTNWRWERDGPLFRARFHSIPVETDAYLLWATRYVHRNPLDLPGVTSPADYRWSSYRAYLGRRPVPPFLDLEPVMSGLGGSVATLVALTEGDEGDGGATVRAGLPGSALSIGQVRRIIDCGLAVEDLTRPDEPISHQGMARTLMVLLAARSSDPHLRTTLVDGLGPRSRRAEVCAESRARARLRSDPALRRVLAWAEAELATATRLPLAA